MDMSDVVDYIAEHKLKNPIYNDKEIRALCPFHQETDGSFFINRETGKWYCWGGCNTGAGIVTLLRKLKLPLSLIKNVPKPRIRREKKQTQYFLPKSILALFDYCPTALLEQGFSEKILQEHRVGFDQRFKRITFPVFSREGHLRLISGRSIIDEDPRYLIYTDKCFHDLISPDLLKNYTPQKQYYFYREDKVKTKQDIILCEGFKAALWLAQYGYNSIASIGLSVTEEGLRKFTRFGTRTLFIMYDSDEAGYINSLVTGRKLLGIPKEIKFFSYPKAYRKVEDKLQPDDLTEKQINEGLATAKTFFQQKREVKHVIEKLKK